MAGHSYPHIVFAKDAGVLPQSRLEEILGEVVPSGRVEHGEIKSDLTLDGWTYTFWYDDDAEGLGERYADYAAPLRRKRVTRCSTMIDASGADDADAGHAEQVQRIMSTLAAQDGVYVFSELTKRFVGMDYDDETGGIAHAPVLQPESDPRSEVSPPAHATPETSEVFLGAHDRFPHGDPRTDESHLPGAREHVPATEESYVAPAAPSGPVPAATSATPGPDVTRPAEPPLETPVRSTETYRPAEPPTAAPVHATPVTPAAAAVPAPPAGAPVPAEPNAPAAVTRPAAVSPSSTAAPAGVAASTPATDTAIDPTPETDTTSSALDMQHPTPVEPAAPASAESITPAEEPEKKGFFKKLFGRKR